MVIKTKQKHSNNNYLCILCEIFRVPSCISRGFLFSLLQSLQLSVLWLQFPPLFLSQIDFLVNNAGRSQRAVVTETKLEVDKAVLQLNTIGTISLTKTVLPHLVEQKDGCIVVINSVAGKMGGWVG